MPSHRYRFLQVRGLRTAESGTEPENKQTKRKNIIKERHIKQKTDATTRMEVEAEDNLENDVQSKDTFSINLKTSNYLN